MKQELRLCLVLLSAILIQLLSLPRVALSVPGSAARAGDSAQNLWLSAVHTPQVSEHPKLRFARTGHGVEALAVGQQVAQNVEFVGSYDTPGSAEAVYVIGDYAYVADGDAGLRVLNISDPASPQQTGYYDTPGDGWDVFVVGDYAYVADGSAGMRVVNVSNPSEPREVASYRPWWAEWARGVFVAGGYAYVADDWAGLRVVNVQAPMAPSEVGFYNTPGSAVGVFVVGRYAHVADDWRGLRIVNIQPPRAPYEVGFYDTPGRAFGVFVAGDYAYVADGSAGMRVVDISKPTSPREVGTHDTPGQALGVFVTGDLAYVADGEAGLRVIDVSNPTMLGEVGFYNTSGAAGNVFVDGGYIYVADRDSGLVVLQYTGGPQLATPTPTPTGTATRVTPPTRTPTPTSSVTPTRTPPTPTACSDAFEPDDQWFQAKVLPVGSLPQQHTFHVPGDVDYAKFVARAGRNYSVRTLNLASGVDTRLYLYGTDGETLLTWNDDDPTNPPASRIDWDSPADGTYFLKTTNLDPTIGGCALTYSIELADTTPAPTGIPRPRSAYLPLVRRDPTPTLQPLVCDGGFEAGRFHPCWQHGGELARSMVERLDVGESTPTVEPPYAGQYSALLGDPGLGSGLAGQNPIPVGSAWIEQSISVPNTAAPHLTFRYRIITYDVAQDAMRQFWDIFTVEINGDLIFWDGNREPGTSQQRHDLDWQQYEVDLSSWRGQTVTVRFANWNGYSRGPGAELYNTWTYLDEVEVRP